jgi:hypothetical protein
MRKNFFSFSRFKMRTLKEQKTIWLFLTIFWISNITAVAANIEIRGQLMMIQVSLYQVLM